MKRILLDTNAYTAFLTGDKRVLNALTEAETAFYLPLSSGNYTLVFAVAIDSRKTRLC